MFKGLTRREFLKTASMAALAMAVPVEVFAAEKTKADLVVYGKIFTAENIDKLPTHKCGGFRYHKPMLLMKTKSDSVSSAGRCPNLFFTSKFLAEIGGFYPCPTSI